MNEVARALGAILEHAHEDRLVELAKAMRAFEDRAPRSLAGLCRVPGFAARYAN